MFNSNRRLLDLNPANRPTAKECLKHPFIHSYCNEPNTTSLYVPLSAFKHEGEKFTLDSLKSEIYTESKDILLLVAWISNWQFYADFCEVNLYKERAGSLIVFSKEEDESSLPSFDTDANNIGFSDIASSLIPDDPLSSNNHNNEFYVVENLVAKNEIENLALNESSSPYGLFTTTAPLETIDIDVSSSSIPNKIINVSSTQSQTCLINESQVNAKLSKEERIMSRETVVEGYNEVLATFDNGSNSFDLAQDNDTKESCAFKASEQLFSSETASQESKQHHEEDLKKRASGQIMSPGKITIRATKSEDRCFSNFDFTMCGSDHSIYRRNSYENVSARSNINKAKANQSLCVIS